MLRNPKEWNEQIEAQSSNSANEKTDSRKREKAKTTKNGNANKMMPTRQKTSTIIALQTVPRDWRAGSDTNKSTFWMICGGRPKGFDFSSKRNSFDCARAFHGSLRWLTWARRFLFIILLATNLVAAISDRIQSQSPHLKIEAKPM